MDGDVVNNAGPRGNIERPVIVGVQIVTYSAGETLHQQQGHRSVFEIVGQESGCPEPVGIRGADGIDAIDQTGRRT